MLKVSFFSYKGGAGRTSLLFNTIPFIAKKLEATEDSPIIVLDLDLDSRGLSYLIKKSCDQTSQKVLKGSIVYRSEERDIKAHPFFSRLIPIGEELGLSQNKSVLFVPAAELGSGDLLGENSNYDGRNISMDTFVKLCAQYNCKAIIMDTPTGEQLSAKSAFQISKKVVTTLRITYQFTKGTYDFLREKATKYKNIEFILVPNAVPTSSTMYDINSIVKGISVPYQEDFFKQNIHLNMSMLENGQTGINEVNNFKFKEVCLMKAAKYRELEEDEQSAFLKYQLLAEEICK